MNEITMKAYAKINLSLDVLGKLPNGYHQVKMVMQQVDLYDLVTVTCEERPEWTETVICGGTSRGDLPMDASNIAYKAAKLMIETYRPDKVYKIAIVLEKHIPMAAGLAGGSADGAAVMWALAKLWQLDVKAEELAALSGKIGSDIPFCVMGQAGQYCALAEGTGTDLTPVTPLDAWIVLSKPPVNVPTKEVYGNLKLAGLEHPDVDGMVTALDRMGRTTIAEGRADWVGAKDDVADRMEDAVQDRAEQDAFETVITCMGNVLETATLPLYPVVGETKKAMCDLGLAEAVLMSGSGPTVFGVFTDEDKARSVYEEMKKIHEEAFVVRTLV